MLEHQQEDLRIVFYFMEQKGVFIRCWLWATRMGTSSDPRVVVMERTNVRNINIEDFTDPIHGIAIDVSFISLKLVLPVVNNLR